MVFFAKCIFSYFICFSKLFYAVSSMWFFLRKPLSSIQSTRITGLSNLKAFDLIIVGIGAMIGCGVFTITGIVAAEFSGSHVHLAVSLCSL